MIFHRNRREADFIFREVFRDNEYLRNGVTLPERPIVVDVGANVGGASVLFGKIRPGARVVAIEPVPHLCRAIELNARLHDVAISVVPCAVGEERRETMVTYYPKNTAMSGLLADQADRDVLKAYLATHEQPGSDAGLDAMVAELLVGETIPCSVKPLGEVLAEQDMDRIDLLKIDVEKSEWQVLQGIDDQLWRRIDQVVMEVHDLDDRVARSVSLLKSKGFNVKVDRNEDLLNTNMYGLYCRRSPMSHDLALPSWRQPLSTPRALGHALRDAFPEVFSGLTVEQLKFATCLPRDARDAIDVDALLARLPAEDPAGSPPAEIEEKLAAIWRKILKVEHISNSDDFFALGGTSMKSVRMVVEVDEAFGGNVLPPDQLFVVSRFDEIAAIIRKNLPK
jgi:FkbM family methyltransferase